MQAFGENASAVSPPDLLLALQRASAQSSFTDAVVCLLNPQRIWEQVDVLQGIWNLRDTLKTVGAMLIMLSPPGVVLPPELSQDVLVIDEPLPSQDILREIVCQTFAQTRLNPLGEEETARAVDALLGLAAFPAEQVVAMSLSKQGLNHNQLWERKRQIIEQAPGLTVWRGGETFEDVGGCANIRRFLEAVLAGLDPPRAVSRRCTEIAPLVQTWSEMMGEKRLRWR